MGRDIPGISSRSKKFFQHANAPGIVAIDYDPPKGLKPLTREELVEILCRAEPALKTTALVWSASASTFLYDSTSQEELRGSGGQRIYLAIRDASDTKRFMETLSVRLWLIQAGRIAVSSSGARLKRTLVDLALANPVQPDFVGGASCGAGVVQRRPKPICIWEGDPLATQALPRLTRLELQQYSALIEVAMKSAEPEAARRREEWRKAQSARIVETISEQGYNKATGLYLKVIGDGWDAIPVDPTDAQLHDAYATLWHPFSMYPWADQIDASVALAGLLTACVRLGLSSAPAFGFDAPSASSGKTKAARVLCSLVDGRESAIVGYPSCSNDQEMSKMLVTKAMEGARSLLIDNVIGIFESAAFAAAMTTSTIEGRILGKSQMTGSLPCRMMTTITGNNLILGSDCSQRVIIARINAGVERPHQRGFKFDPVDHAVENRCRIIVAGLTLLQGFVRAGMPRSSQKTSRFAEWDRLVRQCVLWLQPKLGLDIADPLDAIERNRDSDPALESHDWMLRGLECVFGGNSFTAKDLMDWHEMIKSRLGHIDANQRGLWDAIEGSANGKIRPTTLTVGNMLKFRKEKIVNTRFLECVGERHGGIKAWVVRRSNT